MAWNDDPRIRDLSDYAKKHGRDVFTCCKLEKEAVSE